MNQAVPATGASFSQQVRDIAQAQGWTDATLLAILLNAIEPDPDLAKRLLAACTDVAHGDATIPALPGEAFDDFDRLYGCIQPDEGDTFSFAQVSAADPHYVWSVVEGDDGNLWLMPGFRVVNALGDYVKSERPWTQDSAPCFRWDD
jgi:hypothetical protein